MVSRRFLKQIRQMLGLSAFTLAIMLMAYAGGSLLTGVVEATFYGDENPTVASEDQAADPQSTASDRLAVSD